MALTVGELIELLQEVDPDALVTARLRERDSGAIVTRFFTLHPSIVAGDPVCLFLNVHHKTGE